MIRLVMSLNQRNITVKTIRSIIQEIITADLGYDLMEVTDVQITMIVVHLASVAFFLLDDRIPESRIFKIDIPDGIKKAPPSHIYRTMFKLLHYNRQTMVDLISGMIKIFQEARSKNISPEKVKITNMILSENGFKAIFIMISVDQRVRYSSPDEMFIRMEEEDFEDEITVHNDWRRSNPNENDIIRLNDQAN